MRKELLARYEEVTLEIARLEEEKRVLAARLIGEGVPRKASPKNGHMPDTWAQALELAQKEGGITAADLVRTFGLARGNANAILSKLSAGGRLERVAHGKYRLRGARRAEDGGAS